MSKCLGEVAQCLTRQADFLSIESHMVAISHYFFQDQARLFLATRTSKALGQPETTGGEGALVAAKTIGSRLFGVVTMHERVTCQFFFNAIDSGQHAWIGRACKICQNH